MATDKFSAMASIGARGEIDRQLKILVVEDNSINQEVAMALLETLNCECSLAVNGVEAVAALTRPHTFDLVLMDCQMPELDGFEATRRVRHYEQKQQLHTPTHTPIVALTANAMMGDRDLCLAAGMDDFLSKPFQLHQLSGMLSKWCPQLEVKQDRDLAQQEMRA
jgi:CheY-like chemotaxis protein